MDSEQNVAVFFDVQNLYHSSKNFGGAKISYKALLDYIAKDRKVEVAKAYAAHTDPHQSKNFYKALEAIDIKVLSKFIRRHNDKVSSVHFDCEMSVDAFSVPESVNTIALCTGNGSLSYLVENLIEDKYRVEIWGFRQSVSEKLLSKGALFIQIPNECLLSSKSEE